MNFLKIAILIGCFLFSGCGDRIMKSSFVGECIQTKVVQYIYSGRVDQYKGKLIIGAYDDLNLAAFDNERIHLLKVGSRFRVARVIEGRDWGYGPFMRVQVELMDDTQNFGLIDIPSCVPYHPKPRWVLSCSLNPNDIEINEDVVDYRNDAIKGSESNGTYSSLLE